MSRPSSELIARIQREVDFNDRLVASTIHERAGVKVISLYSLHELFMLLHNNPYPHIDLQRLERWLRTVIQDEELADRIKTIACQVENDFAKLHRVRDLVGMRLMQCRTPQG